MKISSTDKHTSFILSSINHRGKKFYCTSSFVTDEALAKTVSSSISCFCRNTSGIQFVKSDKDVIDL